MLIFALVLVFIMLGAFFYSMVAAGKEAEDILNKTTTTHGIE
jgi:hypothetical protein